MFAAFHLNADQLAIGVVDDEDVVSGIDFGGCSVPAAQQEFCHHGQLAGAADC